MNHLSSEWTAATRSWNDRSRRHKPGLFNLLQSIGLDVVYHRAQGDHVYYIDQASEEVAVLDCVGGYGTLLLGHSHPELVREAIRVLSAETPNHVQGSDRTRCEQLAGELSQSAGGDYCAVFANSGAEAVEAAIKHAMIETGGRTFLALQGGFHGKTLGALQLTENPSLRKPFELDGLNVVHVQADDIAHLESCFSSVEGMAGFVIEPIQGEGGVRAIGPAFARRAAELCREHGVPLIADECQTGMGRTGTFLGCSALGVQPTGAWQSTRASSQQLA